jgi:hypothetical protein
VTRCSEQINGKEPRLQGGAGILEKRSGGRVDVMAAPLAGKGAGSSHSRPVGRFGALRALMALSEAAFKDMAQARFVVWEQLVKVLNCHAWPYLFSFSCGEYMLK